MRKPRKRTPASERFWRKVDRNGLGGCWLYSGSMGSRGRGYGQFKINKGKVQSAHRFAYEDLVGPIPAGLDLDHLCRVRHCVNPEHLEPVTRKENLLRGVGLTAREAAQTHCIHGHPFDAANTSWGSRGQRQCRRCDANRQKARRAARRLAKERLNV